MSGRLTAAPGSCRSYGAWIHQATMTRGFAINQPNLVFQSLKRIFPHHQDIHRHVNITHGTA